ncbi:MAG: AGE family epimerase/isomerase [Pseudomonadota bacterium]|nr:AGE family epimerase/isomerase [Pseudomonadota bacterium]
MAIYPVIMCGGAGSRLWPASRPGRPKQFLCLAGKQSLFQQTALRVAPLVEDDGQLIVVAGERHAGAVVEQLAAIGLRATLLLEPEARDSGPAMAAAAAWIARRDPEGVAAIIASDHHIPDAAAFRSAIVTAAGEARKGRIVTLGVTPTAPSSAYGYIRPGGAGLSPVDSFVEKPDAATAAAYVADGYLWNSGNFIVLAQALMDEIAVHAPAMGEAVLAALEGGDDRRTVRLNEAFRRAPKISIDYAVMEKSDRTSVLPVDFAWSDLGAWDAVQATGLGASGRHLAIDSPDCLVRAPAGTLVATLGVAGLAIIVEPDAVLVCALDRAQEVKGLVDRVKIEATDHADIPQATLTAPFARFGDWMRTSALPLWATLGFDENGSAVEVLSTDGRPGDSPRRARVQSRQIVVFCHAGALGWRGPWRSRVEAGLEHLLGRYLRADGFVRNALAADGSIHDDTAPLYEQAFALLALSQAHAMGVSTDRCEHHAARMLDWLMATRLPAGGWEEIGEHRFQANANMHLFEAAQAWAARGVDPRWDVVAEEIAGLAMDRFIDPAHGLLREFFDADWRPVAGPDGRRVEPGHQFEWCWLLSRYGKTRGDTRALAVARRLYAVGLEGVDPARKVAVDELDDTLAVRSARARLWPQTEWLRAALVMAAETQGDARARHLAEAHQAMQTLDGYLLANGSWRDKRRADGGYVDEAAPASSLYHIMGAFDQVCLATAEGLLAEGSQGLQ